MNSKIADRHLSRQAYVSIRQSTPGQVRFNPESTERPVQSGRQGAVSRLKPGTDPDPRPGSRPVRRTNSRSRGLQDAGQRRGARPSRCDLLLEASRLARSNQDWHRLLELCAITNTLVIDEDGCYDPAEFNDGLVLGMKGTFAQAELHIIRARLHGGKLNKANKGEPSFVSALTEYSIVPLVSERAGMHHAVI